MVLTRSQRANSNADSPAEPAKRPSARGATATSRARAKPKEDAAAVRPKTTAAPPKPKAESARPSSRAASRAKPKEAVVSKAKVVEDVAKPKRPAAPPVQPAKSDDIEPPKQAKSGVFARLSKEAEAPKPKRAAAIASKLELAIPKQPTRAKRAAISKPADERPAKTRRVTPSSNTTALTAKNTAKPSKPATKSTRAGKVKAKAVKKPQTPPEPSPEVSTGEVQSVPSKPASPVRTLPQPKSPVRAMSPIKSLLPSPTRAQNTVQLSASTILQTPRRSQAIRSVVKTLTFDNPFLGSETPSRAHAASTLHESPRRGTVARTAAIKLAASELSLGRSNDLTSPEREKPNGMKSSLMSFKLSGTPMRRNFGTSVLGSSIKAPKTVAALPAPSMFSFSPMKKAAETPIRPRSAHAVIRAQLGTPTRERPQTADFQPMSCLKKTESVEVQMTTKKSVSFGNSPETDHMDSPSEASPFLGVDMDVDDKTVDPLSLHIMTPITEKSGERSSLSCGVLGSAKPSQVPAVLEDTVFYLDVWGSDGSSANQYFVPLLEDMGASIVTEWVPEITHVLFKDGSQITLSRVALNGVYCVNVGWAVDCERLKTRLDETLDQYIIDLGLEQDAAAENTLNLTLNLNFPRTPLRNLSSNAPTPHRPATLGKTPGTVKFAAKLQALRHVHPKPATPTFSEAGENWDAGCSPAVSHADASPLVQKSCPAKQHNKAIFETDPVGSLKKRLFGGNTRKSMGGVLRMRFDDD